MAKARHPLVRPRRAPDPQESDRRDEMRGAAKAARLAVYRDDRETGKPTKAVELASGTSQRTAARWVAQSRERGLR
jgi:hypothetical protein